MALRTVPLPPQARQSAGPLAQLAETRIAGAAITWVWPAAGAVRRSCQRVIMMAAHVITASARTSPAVSAAMRITPRAMWTIWATMGPILAAMTAAPRMTATAAMPAPWPRELSQHDGLHMTGRPCLGSVDHATHLFRMGTDGFWWLAGPGDCRPPGPALVVRSQQVRPC